MDLTAQPSTDPLRIYHYRDGLYAVDLVTAALVHFDLFPGWRRTHQRWSKSARTLISRRGLQM